VEAAPGGGPGGPPYQQTACQQYIKDRLTYKLGEAASLQLSTWTERVEREVAGGADRAAVLARNPRPVPKTVYNTALVGLLPSIARYLPTTRDELCKTPDVPYSTIVKFHPLLTSIVTDWVTEQNLELPPWPAALSRSCDPAATGGAAAAAAAAAAVDTMTRITASQSVADEVALLAPTTRSLPTPAASATPAAAAAAAPAPSLDEAVATAAALADVRAATAGATKPSLLRSGSGGGGPGSWWGAKK